MAPPTSRKMSVSAKPRMKKAKIFKKGKHSRVEKPTQKAPEIFVRIRCPICFKIFGKELVSSTRCGHVFCTSCLKTWLRKRACCPICCRRVKRNEGHHVVYLEDMTEEKNEMNSCSRTKITDVITE